MPRNSAGTYSLPAGNPVVAGTTIDASWANDTMNDLANEITNSLSRTGAGGMLAPFRVADGSVSAPGLGFTNETNSGLYRSGAGELWFTIGGVAVAQITANGLLLPSGKRITLPTPVNATDGANKQYVDDQVAPVIGYADLYLGSKTSDPTTNNSGGALVEGVTYWSSTLQQMRVYNGTNWVPMPTISALVGQTFSGTGAQTAFTLANPTGNAINLEVFISGVRQVPTTDYSVSSTTLTFVTAPPSGANNIFVRYAQLANITDGAGSIVYTPAGTGAVATNVQTKLRESVSVKDFGATSASTDVENKTALQSAIAAVSDAGGGTVIVPNDIDYGYKINVASTYPDFSSLTNGDVVVIDYGCVDNETTGKVGANIRKFFGTKNTSPTAGQHNGNGELISADWHPYQMIQSVNPPDQPPGTNTDPYRASVFFQAIDSTGGNVDGWRIGQRDPKAGFPGTTFEQWLGFGLSVSKKFIYNTGTSAWRYSAGASALTIDRYTGCWGFNTTADDTYGYRFYMPTGMRSKVFAVYGEDSTMLPTLNLLAAGTTNKFTVTPGTGSTSYSVAGGYSHKIIFDTSGNVHIGYTLLTSNNHTITRYNAAMVENDTILQSYGQGFNVSLTVNAVSADGSNAAGTALKVAKNSSTGRSINAGGTVNASGADYAEYEQNNGLSIPKGSIVGFKADGTLTLTFTEAVRFGVKSTNPSYVGGDVWGSEDAVGPRPVQPADDAEQSAKDQYATDLAAFEERLEVERQKVDRVAYSGKVPVNVIGASAGGYIIASAAQDGSIVGEFVEDPDFAQYKKAVGRVNRILPDGRAEVAVIVH